MMKKFDQINVIPFIDIMLVLLAIVLTTATFVVQGNIPVTLPESDQVESAAKPEDSIRLTISADRTLYWDEEAIDLPELGQRLAAREPQPVRLQVDANVNFGRFVEVTDILKQERFRDVAILARRAADRG